MRAEVVRTRPPRTEGHAQLGACLKRFIEAGLNAVVSTNGSNPEADIQIVKGPQSGEVIEAWVTERGEARFPRPERKVAAEGVQFKAGDTMVIAVGAQPTSPKRKPAARKKR